MIGMMVMMMMITMMSMISINQYTCHYLLVLLS